PSGASTSRSTVTVRGSTASARICCAMTARRLGGVRRLNEVPSSCSRRWLKKRQYASLTNVRVVSGRKRQTRSVWASTTSRKRRDDATSFLDGGGEKHERDGHDNQKNLERENILGG